ncbi:unnamed protein product [Oikopleura dioica]|uniref:Hexosyltransferase n=1 Tax=Oikopleura dioica TaxID=34765 RepID=E4X4T6_OIKDI|nr:unnamed protein product [Oikopleura dioica]
MSLSNKQLVLVLLILIIPYYFIFHFEAENDAKYARSFLEKNFKNKQPNFEEEITAKDESIKFYVNTGSYWNSTTVEEEYEIIYKPKYTEKETDLIFGVKSEWKKKPRRDAVRNTYGKSIYYKKFGFTAKFVFLFGLPQNSSYLSELAEHDDMLGFRINSESQILLQGRRRYSFKSISLQQVFGRQQAHCRSNDLGKSYKTRTANWRTGLEFLSFLENLQFQALIRAEHIGTGWDKYVDLVWNETHYPPYVSGASLFMNKGAVDVLKENIRKLPKIPIDDAFLGICMRKGGYNENHVGKIPAMIRFVGRERTEVCEIEKSIAIHKYTPEILECIWPIFLEHRSKCNTSEKNKIEKIGQHCDPETFWFEKAFVKPPLESNNEDYGRCGLRYNFSSCPQNSNDWNAHCSGPCCSPNGYCGLTSDHCACSDCVDFRQEEIEEKDICCNIIEIS